MFDENSFMSTETSGEMSTEFTPVPEGEYQGLAKKVGVRSGESDKGTWAVLDVTWGFEDASVVEATGMDSPSARQSVFLDLTEDGGLALGKGKNIQLGKLREAIGQNNPGAWAPSMIEGSVAICKVEHRLYNDQLYADVKHVSAV